MKKKGVGHKAQGAWLVIVMAIVAFAATACVTGCATTPQQEQVQIPEETTETLIKMAAFNFGYYVSIKLPEAIVPGLAACQITVGEGSEALVALLMDLKAEWLEKIDNDEVLLANLNYLMELLLLPLENIMPGMELDPEKERLVRIAIEEFCKGLGSAKK